MQFLSIAKQWTGIVRDARLQKITSVEHTLAKNEEGTEMRQINENTKKIYV